MSAPWKSRLVEEHTPRWSATLLWASFAALFFALQGIAILLLNEHLYGLCVPLVFILAYLKHCHLIAFHEASHRNLCPVNRLNDAIGYFISTLSFMSLTLYRAVHRFHHVYLGTTRDEELWPFVDPTSPRWFRRLSAVLEMMVGLIYTPFLFLRCFLHKNSPITDRATRRLIWIELTSLVVFWGSTLAVTARFGLWPYLMVLYVIPAWMAGNLQTIRKYVEHLGVTGPPPLGVTRSIVPVGVVDRFIVFTLFHEPYHGIHHRYARLPQAVFPEFVDLLTPTEPGQLAPYSSYRQAFVEMIQSLSDPRTGSQWLENANVTTDQPQDEQSKRPYTSAA